MIEHLFEYSGGMNPQPTIEAMRTAALALSSGDVRESLHAVQAAQDALDAAKSMLLAELQGSKEFELDGASTLNAWVRNQLRLKPGQASILVRNVQALGDLSLVAEAALAGKMSAAHVAVFAYGLRHIGLESMREFEAEFVEVALARAPGDLFEAVKHLQDVLHPEDLDEKYLDGMEKEDFSIEEALADPAFAEEVERDHGDVGTISEQVQRMKLPVHSFVPRSLALLDLPCR